MDDVVEFERLLTRFGDGEIAATDRLLPIVYDELRRIAASSMRRERRGHTWRTTDLAHEAWLRLCDQRQADPARREQFLALAAETIRRVLVDHARKRNARVQGDRRRVTLESADFGREDEPVDVLALEAVLSRLAGLDPRQARVVELRFFGGLTIEETARVLSVSPGTVKGDWLMARAYLRRGLAMEDDA
jgi:RNA polymerase sigma-70 factor (ECF subfamily)